MTLRPELGHGATSLVSTYPFAFTLEEVAFSFVETLLKEASVSGPAPCDIHLAVAHAEMVPDAVPERLGAYLILSPSALWRLRASSQLRQGAGVSH